MRARGRVTRARCPVASREVVAKVNSHCESPEERASRNATLPFSQRRGDGSVNDCRGWAAQGPVDGPTSAHLVAGGQYGHTDMVSADPSAPRHEALLRSFRLARLPRARAVPIPPSAPRRVVSAGNPMGIRPHPTATQGAPRGVDLFHRSGQGKCVERLRRGGGGGPLVHHREPNRLRVHERLHVCASPLRHRRWNAGSRLSDS